MPTSDDDGDAAFRSIDCDEGIVTQQELKVKEIDIDVGLTWSSNINHLEVLRDPRAHNVVEKASIVTLSL